MKKISFRFTGFAAVAVASLFAQSPHPMASGFQDLSSMANSNAYTSRIEGSQSGPVVGKPFSATETRRTVQTLSDGSHVNHSDTSYFYRDAQGRVRVESPDRVEIYDPVSMYEYDLNPKSKRYTRVTHSGNIYQFSMAVVGGTSWTSFHSGTPTQEQKASSGMTEDLSAQWINGVSARGTRITLTIPANTFGNERDLKVVNERWYSDDLQALVKSSNSDPRFGVTTYELTNLQRVPPDVALFQVPADYVLKEDRHQ